MTALKTIFYILALLLVFTDGSSNRAASTRSKRTQAYRFYDFIQSGRSTILKAETVPDADTLGWTLRRDCAEKPDMDLIDRPAEAFFIFETLGRDWYPGNLGLALEQNGPNLYDYTGQKRTEIRWLDVSEEVHSRTGCQMLQVMLFACPIPRNGFCVLSLKDNALVVLPQHCYHADFDEDIIPDEENKIWLHGVRYFPDKFEYGEAIFNLCSDASCDQRVDTVEGLDDLKLTAVRLHMYEQSL